ncbi:MAG: hypothetical protein IJT97_09670 [Bacteroidaceae bacterium]|nr:hypothetical protein [Bacteroidaceae bacterium]
MKKTLLSLLMMATGIMANAQLQTVSVEYLNGDMDEDDQITVNDVTGLVGVYLDGTTPRNTVEVTVDNTDLIDLLNRRLNELRTELQGCWSITITTPK